MVAGILVLIIWPHALQHMFLDIGARSVEKFVEFGNFGTSTMGLSFGGGL